MDQSFIGSVVIFGGNFAPVGWMFCNGQLLPIAQYTALFSILGTTYGGDGQTTFALPDLRGRVSLSQGQGPGLGYYDLGQVGGVENTTLLSPNLPAHNHSLQVSAQVQVSTQAANSDEPNGAFLTTTGNNFYATAGTANNNLGGVSASGTTGAAGNNQPMSVLQPTLAINYIICFEGIYPARN